MNDKQHKKLKELYQNYNKVVKPLLATVEASYHVISISVINEIRLFNDHIARCYIDDIETERIDNELIRAESHITRTTIDLFKYLIVYFFDEIERFEKQAKHLDLIKIDNGKFYLKYRSLKKQAREKYRKSKLIEEKQQTDFFEIAKNYEEVFNIYSELIDLIESDLGPISKLRENLIYGPIRKSILTTAKWILLTIFSTVVSILLTILFYDSIKEGIDRAFGP